MSNRQDPKQPLAPSRPSWYQMPIVWAAGLIGIALVAALAISALADDDTDTTTTADQSDVGTSAPAEEIAFAETIGTPLPELSAPDPAVGTPVPMISAQTLTGERVQIQTDGVSRLYGFFAHWCPHCQAELPRTAAWLESNPLPDNVEVIAVSTAVDDAAPNYPPSAWFAREEWPATVLIDSAERDLAAGFGLTAFPYWVAVAGDGTVITRLTGEIDDAQFADLIEILNSRSES